MTPCRKHKFSRSTARTNSMYVVGGFERRTYAMPNVFCGRRQIDPTPVSSIQLRSNNICSIVPVLPFGIYSLLRPRRTIRTVELEAQVGLDSSAGRSRQTS